jgi:hypothetical protein
MFTQRAVILDWPAACANTIPPYAALSNPRSSASSSSTKSDTSHSLSVTPAAMAGVRRGGQGITYGFNAAQSTPRPSSAPSASRPFLPCSRARLAASFRRHRWLLPRCVRGADRTSGAPGRRYRRSLSSGADAVLESASRIRTSQSPGRRKWRFRECLRTRLNFTGRPSLLSMAHRCDNGQPAPRRSISFISLLDSITMRSRVASSGLSLGMRSSSAESRARMQAVKLSRSAKNSFTAASVSRS